MLARIVGLDSVGEGSVVCGRGGVQAELLHACASDEHRKWQAAKLLFNASRSVGSASPLSSQYVPGGQGLQRFSTGKPAGGR